VLAFARFGMLRRIKPRIGNTIANLRLATSRK
jgi:hypothetical protein